MSHGGRTRTASAHPFELPMDALLAVLAAALRADPRCVDAALCVDRRARAARAAMREEHWRALCEARAWDRLDRLWTIEDEHGPQRWRLQYLFWRGLAHTDASLREAVDAYPRVGFRGPLGPMRCWDVLNCSPGPDRAMVRLKHANAVRHEKKRSARGAEYKSAD
jgi:hypothetical protein